MALARSKIALASFSRAQEFEADGIGVGIAARAGFDPYGAVRFLTAMGRNADLRQPASNGVDPRFARLPLLASGDARPREERARPTRANITAPGAGDARQATAISPSIDGLRLRRGPERRLSCAAAASCIRELGFTFTAPDGFTLENTAQAVLGVRDSGNQALRLDVVRCRPSRRSTEYLASGWIENVDDELDRGVRRSTACRPRPRSPRATSGRSASTRSASAARSTASSSPPRQLTPETDRAFRYSVATFRR